jgi:hypothetical protein
MKFTKNIKGFEVSYSLRQLFTIIKLMFKYNIWYKDVLLAFYATRVK